MNWRKLRKREFEVPTELGAPEIAKFMAIICLFILPLAIVKYFMSGDYHLSLYYTLLSAMILIDIRAHLRARALPINATMLLVAIQIGDLMLIANHGTSAAFWLFPITVAGFFYCSLAASVTIGGIVSVVAPVLAYRADGDFWFSFRMMVALITVIAFMRFMILTLRALHMDLRQSLEKDVLTGCLNRLGFNNKIDRGDFGLGRGALLFIDIDHFKKINDAYGHFVGDQVLAEMAQVIRAQLPEGIDLFRFGGEEFIVVYPNLPDGLSLRLAERIRKSVSAQSFPEKAKVTVSIGVESYRNASDIHDALTRADTHLYRAKRAGRDRVAGAS